MAQKNEIVAIKIGATFGSSSKNKYICGKRALARIRIYIMKRTHSIGFDATKANDNITGRGNYSCFVIESLSKACSENTYFRMYTPKRLPNPTYDALDNLPNVESMEPDGSFWRKFPTIWRLWRLSHDAKAGDIELFHGLDNRLPLGLAKHDIRSVVTVHDLHFISHPTSILPLKRLFQFVALRSTCRRADRIIAVSESTKRDIIKYLDIDGDKIDVIYPGYNPIYGSAISDERVREVREKYDLPERYIINVGAQHERRNIATIIDAMDKLDYEIHLVAVGRRTMNSNRLRRQARNAAIETRLHLLHDVDNDDLAALYRGATALVYPSLDASFGTPIVEAMSAGIPVIGAKGSSHEEAGGSHSIYVTPNDSSELAEKIDLLLNDEALRQEMIAKGKDYVTRFRAEVCAYNILNCYKRLGIDITDTIFL